MRRVYALIGIWFALAGAATVAFGGPIRVRVENPPSALITGQPYVVNLLVLRYGRKLRDAQPVVTLHYASGGSVSYRATAGPDGVYRVRVIAPLPGAWSYEVHVNGHVATRGTLAAKLVSP